jgi:hypothetical protein
MGSTTIVKTGPWTAKIQQVSALSSVLLLCHHYAAACMYSTIAGQQCMTTTDIQNGVSCWKKTRDNK